MDIRRGIIRAFDSGTYLADVQIVGSVATILSGVPVAKQIGADLITSGAKCGVLFFDETNPSDACVVFVYDGAPVPWVTSDLIKDGEVAIADLANDAAVHHARHEDGGTDALTALLSTIIDLQYEQDSSGSSQTTTSDAYVDITGASITVTGPGKFFIIFSGDVQNDTAGKGVWVHIERNGTEVGNPRLCGGAGYAAGLAVSSNALWIDDVTTSGSRTYKARFCRHQGGTAKVERWVFIVMKFKT